MLISFTVENWQSFRDKSTLTLVASKEKQHGEHVPKIDKYNLRLLPLAAIYGANASGKTKFFNALDFAQKFITNISDPDTLIPREPFKLDPNCADKPSRFIFELLIEDAIYEFSFAITEEKVVEEKLIKVSSNSQKVLYERNFNLINEIPDFNKLGIKDNNLIQQIKYVYQGTRPNVLFLTNSVYQNIEIFKPIYNWFKDKLVLISPDASYARVDKLIDKDFHLYEVLNKTLDQLDTGITRLGTEEISVLNLNLPKEISNKILEGQKIIVKSLDGKKRFFVTRINGQLKVDKLVAYHKSINGQEIPFDFESESAGTQRLTDLLPGFLGLAKQSKVYFIDELDRCLHNLLTYKLIENYLFSCSHETRSQLIFTTHDVLLMDQRLLRRDEIWFTEKK